MDSILLDQCYRQSRFDIAMSWLMVFYWLFSILILVSDESIFAGKYLLLTPGPRAFRNSCCCMGDSFSLPHSGSKVLLSVGHRFGEAVSIALGANSERISFG